MSELQWYKLELLIEMGSSDTIDELAFSTDVGKLKDAAQAHAADIALEWVERDGKLYAWGESGSGGFYSYHIKPTKKRIIL